MDEPRLSPEDELVWNTWRMTALAHAGTREHMRRVDAAKRCVDAALALDGDWLVMWSAGKDSTAMSHLITVEMGHKIELVSEKDDLDYPGEREYIERLATTWGARLRVVTPDVSPMTWMANNARYMEGDDDMHGRSSGMSKACFYDVVERASKGRFGVFLGLRKGESKGRNLNRCTHGLIYRKKGGQHVAQPLGDWEGIDVYAYMFKRGIDFLPVYKCVSLMHAKEPWRIRKSWWVPGSSARHGQVTWLRNYWPSLYMKLVDWLPNTRTMG